MAKNKNKKRLSQPLVTPPHILPSRKKARKTTTLFHKITRQIDQVIKKSNTTTLSSAASTPTGTTGNDNVTNTSSNANNTLLAQLHHQLDAMGGRAEYQRASQTSTKFHSTSKWVLSVLAQLQWLHGIEVLDTDPNYTEDITTKSATSTTCHNCNNGNHIIISSRKKKMVEKRPVRILEVGAINTELVDAASKTHRVLSKKTQKPNKHDMQQQSQQHPQQQEYLDQPMYNLFVRAIDLRSTSPKIEEMDFLKLPLPTIASTTGTNNNNYYYDVIVCSMVLNCVTTPSDRGKMLTLLYKHLQPGGFCFFTLPKLCLTQSKYLSRELFESMLVDAIGFKIWTKRDSPKVAFWVLKRPMSSSNSSDSISSSLNLNRKNNEERNRDCESQNNKSKSNRSSQLEWNEKWSNLTVVNTNFKKCRDSFGILLCKEDMPRYFK